MTISLGETSLGIGGLNAVCLDVLNNVIVSKQLMPTVENKVNLLMGILDALKSHFKHQVHFRDLIINQRDYIKCQRIHPCVAIIPPSQHELPGS